MAEVFFEIKALKVSEASEFSSKKSGKKNGSSMSKRNGFSVYMEERRADILARGHKLTRGRCDLANLVSEDWKALPGEEKDKYNEEAKQYNRRAKSERFNKGQSSADAEKPLANAAGLNLSDKDKQAMEQARVAVYNLFRNEDWMDHPVVLCNFTAYFQADLIGDEYIPAEIGMATMTLNGGVCDNFARVIDPGSIPKGHEDDAAETIKCLGIPGTNTVPEFSDYENLMNLVECYLEKYQGNLRREKDELCVFAFDSDYELIHGGMKWLLAKIENRFSVKVLSLDLYAYMASIYHQRPGLDDSVAPTISPHRIEGKPLTPTFAYPAEYPMTAFGRFRLESDVDYVIKQMGNFKFIEELCCSYHYMDGNAVQHCALNMSNRHAYSLLEILTISNEVPTTGRHFPKIEAPDDEWNMRFTWLRQWGITNFESQMTRNSPDYDDPDYINLHNNWVRSSRRATLKVMIRPRVNFQDPLGSIQEEIPDSEERGTRQRNPGRSPQLYSYGALQDEDGNPFVGGVPTVFRRPNPDY